jgi:hypothetical protein
MDCDPERKCILHMDPGKVGPIYKRPFHSYKVLNGNVSCIYRGGEKIFLEQGGDYNIPSSHEHFIVNSGDEPADLMLKRLEKGTNKNIGCHKILFFGGFSCPPQLYDSIISQMSINGHIIVEVVDWMNEKEKNIHVPDIGFQNVIIVGHSMGCQAGLKFYESCSKSVKSIILFDYHPYTIPYTIPSNRHTKNKEFDFFPHCSDESVGGEGNDLWMMEEVMRFMDTSKFQYFSEKFVGGGLPKSGRKILIIMATKVIVGEDGRMKHICVNNDDEFTGFDKPDVYLMRLNQSNHFWFMKRNEYTDEILTGMWKWIVKVIADESILVW